MPPLDLRPLRPRLEELILVDHGEFYRDPGGNTDDVTDPTTGAVTTPPAQLELILSTKCKFRHVLRDVGANEIGVFNVIGGYELAIPAVGPEINGGDIFILTASVHQPRFVGKVMRVEEIRLSSFGVFSKLRLELRERNVDRP